MSQRQEAGWEPSPGAQSLLGLGVGLGLEKRIARALPLSACASEEMAVRGHTGMQLVGFFKNMSDHITSSTPKPSMGSISFREKAKVLCHQSYHLSHNWQVHSSCVSHTDCLVSSPNSRHIPASGPLHWLFPLPEALHSDVCISTFSFSSNFSSKVPFLVGSSKSPS